MTPTSTTASGTEAPAVAFAFGAPGGGVLALLSWWLLTLASRRSAHGRRILGVRTRGDLPPGASVGASPRRLRYLAPGGASRLGEPASA